MAHEFESGFFVGEKAWHGLGTVLKDPPTIEEALKIAGLDWTVSESPILVPTGMDFLTLDSEQDQSIVMQGLNADVPFVQMYSHKALVRSTDKRVLGIVGKDFSVIQPANQMHFFNDIVADGTASLETAMSLKKGSRIVVTAKIKSAVADVVAGDPVECYLVAAQGFDGSLCFYVIFSPVRVVCNNTLTLAVNRADNDRDPCIRLKHTKGIKDALELVRKSIDLNARAFSFTVEQFRSLAGKAINSEKLEKYVKALTVETPEQKQQPDMLTKLEELPRAYYKIMEAYEDQPGIQYGRGTFWQAYNAVTHYVDHVRGRTDETRLEASWFGAGKELRDRALGLALTM